MCGIAGFVDFSGTTPSQAILRAMTEALRRRGPDAQAVVVDGACGLAHTRLSIIDLAGSPQPMQVSGSDISLVYNGELYNYRELRAELQQSGRAFHTSGDTEVLLRWLDQEWDGALTRFDGMFGFAAWDRRQERLLLARDPIGVKPLFYAQPTPDTIVFGSEVKAVLIHPEVDAELDTDALRQILRFRAVYGDGSLRQGVRQLLPGTFLEFSRSGARTGQYYDLIARAAAARSSLVGLSDAAIIAQGEGLLQDAVRKRLIADVPVGAFLSGGLDSSLIVALVRRMRQPDELVHTFSVGFEDDPASELPFAHVVAEAIGTRHAEVRVDGATYLRRMAEMTACRDAPLSEPADVAIACMSGVAREHVKVVLSGEGADEVFGGYPKYRFAVAPRGLGALLRTAGAEHVAWLAGKLGVDRRRALVAARALSLPRELDRLVQWFSYLDRAELQWLLPGLGWSGRDWASTTDSQAAALERAEAGTPLGRMQAVDCLTWLPGNMLERGDRMTMAEGLELRVPFLDRRLAPFGLAIDDRLKVRGRTSKWIVRRWAAHLLPREIVGRKKWGFRVPLHRWFCGGAMREMLHDYLSAAHGLCGTYGDRQSIQQVLRRHDSGAADLSLSLWTLLSAEVWFQDVYLNRTTAGNTWVRSPKALRAVS